MEKWSSRDDSQRYLSNPDGSRYYSQVNHENTFKMDLLNMLNDPTTSDFSIVVDEKEFKVHRVILQARSKYFAALFSSRNRESETGRIDVQQIDVQHMTIVLRFIYGAKLPSPAEVTLELYQVADMYRLIDLKYYCLNVLASSLTSSNIITFLHHAEFFQDDRLIDVGVCYVMKNLDKLLASEVGDEILEWKQLIKRILQYQNEKLNSEQ